MSTEALQTVLANKVETPHGTLHLPPSPAWYRDELPAIVAGLSSDAALSLYRFLGKYDLYFLVSRILSSRNIRFKVKGGVTFWDHPWIFNRCREVQLNPDGNLDLWARGHGKSTIITFGLTIQDLIRDQETTFGIFSNTRPLAKGFLRLIKMELETNKDLVKLYPDRFWEDPKKQAPKWSEDEGITIKREGNPKEASIEAWGVLDGMPTGKHFDVLLYDDVVEESTVTNPEQVAKTLRQWELSTNLSKPGGRKRYIGTRYAFADLYHTIMDRGAARPRIRAALSPPSFQNGEPTFFDRDFLKKIYEEQGPYTFAAQQLLNPVAEDVAGFNLDWLRYYQSDPAEMALNMNVYMLVDPASTKKKTSDYTVIAIVGLGADDNFYLLDMIRDRLNTHERVEAVFAMHVRWKPYEVRYESYGIQSDTDFIRYVQEKKNYRFPIVEVAGQVKKEDRIRRLIPVMSNHRFYVPESLIRSDYQGKDRDMVKALKEEMSSFPVGIHDDILDTLARLQEPDFPLSWPTVMTNFPRTRRDRWAVRTESTGESRSWLSA